MNFLFIVALFVAQDNGLKITPTIWVVTVALAATRSLIITFEVLNKHWGDSKK